MKVGIISKLPESSFLEYQVIFEDSYISVIPEFFFTKNNEITGVFKK